MTRMPAVLPLLLCLLLVPLPAAAQSLSGTYTVTSSQGGVVTLVLTQSANGELRGTMSGNGQQFQIEAQAEGGTAVGVMHDGQSGVYFEAELDGARLIVRLLELGPDNVPDATKGREIVFSRAGAAAPPPEAAPSPRAQGNPLVGAGAAAAQDPWVGTFAGDGITLELQGGRGRYSGSLTVQGESYPASAQASGSRLTGTFTVGGQSYGFEATLQGGQLALVSEGSTYRLQRQGGGAAPSAGPVAGRAAAAGRGAGSLLGSWSCQTASGPAQLNFVSDRQLVFNGETSEYTLGPGVVQVEGVEYPYQLNGDMLTVQAPDGVMQCRRQAGGGGAVGAAGGGTGMEGRLRGRICAYSSSSGGGYSSTRILTFDGQGNFSTGGETYFNVPDATGAAASRGGGYGRYVVTGTQKGAPIQLTFPDGSQGVAYVYSVNNQGMIEAFQFNGEIYYTELCP